MAEVASPIRNGKKVSPLKSVPMEEEARSFLRLTQNCVIRLLSARYVLALALGTGNGASGLRRSNFHIWKTVQRQRPVGCDAFGVGLGCGSACLRKPAAAISSSDMKSSMKLRVPLRGDDARRDTEHATAE